MKNGRNARNGWIEFCRFVLAMCVVCHHSQLMPGDHGYIPFVSGYLGVEFFYILTGYFLSASVSTDVRRPEECSGFSEVIKRLKKIYPYFLVAWLMSFVICHVVHGHNDSGNLLVDIVFASPQLLFLSMFDLAGGNIGVWDYLGTSWYLSALLFGILAVYPFMKKHKTLFSSTIAPITALIIYGAIFFSHRSFGVVNERVAFFSLGNLRAVAGLSLGSFCQYIVQRLPECELSKNGKLLFSIGQLLVFAAILLLLNETHSMYSVILLMLFCALIIFSFAGNTYLNAFFSHSLFSILGRFSMIIFITQSIAYMYPWLPYPAEWNWRFLAMLGYVIMLSIANAGIVGFLRLMFRTFKPARLWQKEDGAEG